MSTRVIVVRRGSNRYRNLLLSLAAGAAVRAGMHFVVSRNLHKRSAALKELEKAIGSPRSLKSKAKKTARRVAAGARKDARLIAKSARNSDVIVVMDEKAEALFDRTKTASAALRKRVLKGIKNGKAVVASVPAMPKLAQSWNKVVKSVTRA